VIRTVFLALPPALRGPGSGAHAQVEHPDRQRELAFSRELQGNADIYVVRADGRGLRRLTHSRGPR
jgi:hypothetical protein